MKETRDSIADVWGARTPHGEGEWPARVDERTVEKPEKWVQSCCILCSNGCALDIGVKDGKIVGVRGRRADRVNRAKSEGRRLRREMRTKKHLDHGGGGKL